MKYDVVNKETGKTVVPKFTYQFVLRPDGVIGKFNEDLSMYEAVEGYEFKKQIVCSVRDAMEYERDAVLDAIDDALSELSTQALNQHVLPDIRRIKEAYLESRKHSQGGDNVAIDEEFVLP